MSFDAKAKFAVVVAAILVAVIINFAAFTLIDKQRSNVAATKANTEAVATLCQYFGYQAKLLHLQIAVPPVGDSPSKAAARSATLVFEEQFLKESC